MGKIKIQRHIAIIKSLIIISLAALAIYQTSQLWFVNLTNRNFFPYLEARFPPSVPDGRSAWAQPFRIIYGAGDGVFSIRYSGIENSYSWEFGANALDAILNDGSFVRVSNVAAPAERFRLLSSPVLIYEYFFPMQAETFALSMGRRNAATLTNHNVESFTSIAIQPPTEFDTFLRVFFMDDTRAWEFTLSPGARRNPAENFAFEVPNISPTEKHFVAINNGFAPRAPHGFFYRAIEAHNPFLTLYDQLIFDSIRPQVTVFFSNPAAINQTTGTDGILTFTTHNTMVRYLPFDVLEYTSHRPIGRTAPGNLLSDFSAALAFIEADPNVVNEIFLMNYEPSGRVHTFHFGYVINNFPLQAENEWATGPNCRNPLPAPIEVVVDHGRVVRYRRLAVNFQSGELTRFDAERLNIEEPFTLGFPITRNPISHLETFVTGD